MSLLAGNGCWLFEIPLTVLTAAKCCLLKAISFLVGGVERSGFTYC